MRFVSHAKYENVNDKHWNGKWERKTLENFGSYILKNAEKAGLTAHHAAGHAYPGTAFTTTVKGKQFAAIVDTANLKAGKLVLVTLYEITDPNWFAKNSGVVAK